MKDSNNKRNPLGSETNNVQAILEDNVNEGTFLKIQARNQEETHRLVHNLKESGFRFEKMPSKEEIDKMAHEYANEHLQKHLATKMENALSHKKLLVRLASRYIYNKT